MADCISCRIDLPANFRREDFLAFHRRDSQSVAEKVASESLEKGLSWDGDAACLRLRFEAAHVVAELALDAPRATHPGDALLRLECRVAHMLGLTQPVAAFEQRHRPHPHLGGLIAARPGLRVPQTATPFEALCWAVIGQQISVVAAVSVRRKFIRAAGRRHSGGLYCFPDASLVGAMSEDALREAGLSQAKARTLTTLSRQVETGALPLDGWLAKPDAAMIHERLLQVPGIGPWTVAYALLRGFAHLDGSLHGDVAVRRKLQQLLGGAEKIGEAFTRDWLADFSPWRALVAAHLWAFPADS